LLRYTGDLKREHRTTKRIRPANSMVNPGLQVVHFPAGRDARERTHNACATNHVSANSQLSKLWRRCFIRRTAMPILRIKAGGGRVSVVLCHDVHWQQALSELWLVSNSAHAGRAVGSALPALQSGHVIGADRSSDDARVRKVRRGLAGCCGF